MSEHDGLTAEQEAEERYPPMWNWAGSQRRSSHVRRKAFIEGAKWATEREKARAEAAEARVAEMKAALLETALYMLGPERWRGAIWVCRMCGQAGPAGGPAQFPSECKIEHAADCLLFATPTTGAVTEVEGS